MKNKEIKTWFRVRGWRIEPTLVGRYTEASVWVAEGRHETRRPRHSDVQGSYYPTMTEARAAAAKNLENYSRAVRGDYRRALVGMDNMATWTEALSGEINYVI